MDRPETPEFIPQEEPSAHEQELEERGSVGGESAHLFFTKTGRYLIEEALPKQKGIVVHITVRPLRDRW